MVVLKLLLCTAFVRVAFEDLKDRYVYWFWFPVIGICSGCLLYQNVSLSLFFETLLSNLGFVSLLIGIIYIYATYKLKIKRSETFGLGDGLLFIGLTFSFPFRLFLVVFVFGLVFSLVLHVILKKSKTETVPLAGYMSLFFLLIYLAHWLGFFNAYLYL